MAVLTALNPICIGIDIGKVTDPAAIAVAEVQQVPTGKVRYSAPRMGYMSPGGEWIPPKGAEPLLASDYTIRHIERVPLGTSYPALAEKIAALLKSDRFKGRNVRALIDVTGVGRPVYDDVRIEIDLLPPTQRPTLKPISFVHGESYNKRTGSMGKAYLVSRLQSLLQNGRIHAPDTAEMRATLDELRVYEIKISQDGKDTYGASTGKHDDLATALGLACLENPFSERVTTSSARVY